MASVFKRRELRQIPEGSEIIKYRGKRYAAWTDPKGKARRAPLNEAGDKIVQEAEFYSILYFDHTGKRRKKGTRYPDKDAAQQYANLLEKDAEDRRRGIIDCKQERYAKEARRPVSEHLTDYRQYLQDKENTAKHIEHTARHVETILQACHIERITDLDGSAVMRVIGQLRDAGKSLRTCNAHLTSIKGFSRWLWKEKRTPDNPLIGLSKFNEETDRRHERRELSEDELRWLLATVEAQGKINYNLDASTRTMAYRVALGSGFRTNELRTLKPTSFDLDADPPTVTAEAAYSKRRRKDVQPISEELAELLAGWLEGRERDARLFPLPHNTSKMFQRDLAAARAEWIKAGDSDVEREAREQSDFLSFRDAAGRFADFYATRHTYISGLVAGGKASVKTLQELARHSTPVLTIGRYSHARLHDLTAALEALPDLTPEKTDEPPPAMATGTDGVQCGSKCGSSRAAKWRTEGAKRGESESPQENAIARHNVLKKNILGERRRDVAEVVRARIELATHGFSVRCSTN